MAARLAAAPRPRQSLETEARGDHDLNPGFHPRQPLVPAAVLVPLVDHPEGLTVLLTLRTLHLHDHAGQVSFPGGRIEPGDSDAAAAALRETAEEVGLKPERVRLVGRLTGMDSENLSKFFAHGMLLNVLAMMGQVDEPQAWALRLIEGSNMTEKLDAK